jgi:hypothetical protein
MLEGVVSAECSASSSFSCFPNLAKQMTALQGSGGAVFESGDRGPSTRSSHNLDRIVSTCGLIYVLPYSKGPDVGDTAKFGWSSNVNATASTPVSCTSRRRWDF